MTSAHIVEFRGPDVVAPIRRDHGDLREPFDDPPRSLRHPVSLKQFLQNDSRRMDRFTASQCIPQSLYLGQVGG